LAGLLAVSFSPNALAKDKPVSLSVTQLGTIPGSDRWDWWQARTTPIVTKEGSLWLTTMSETGKKVSHDFHDIYESVSRDRGMTWSTPEKIAPLSRIRTDDGYEVAAGDLWPGFHAKSRMVLSTGKTFNFADGTKENFLRERVLYAVMDPGTNEWSPMKFLDVPEKDHGGFPMLAANAGTTQRWDLANGDVLLPVRYQRNKEKRIYTSVVMRCSFDGRELKYIEHGSEHEIPEGRGLYEPSLIKFGGRFFLTLRADHSSYVTRGVDGINYEPAREWLFDDGTPLGSYNTQQHWAVIGKGLFLIYTRKGADNDHIMRHRAPLFIGQVDPETLRVIRKSERIVFEENQATLGNSGVCRISSNEALITCGEGLLRLGKRKGENNRVLFAIVRARF
ncbi:MAG: exo-alpha-sialidase, partial [Verrucomicrobiota bacterium]